MAENVTSSLDEIVERLEREIDATFLEKQDEAAAPETGERFGRYRILRTLGRGGFGTVYLARDDALEREVALKVLHAEHASNDGLRSSLAKEARLLARLSHPNIVSVYGVEEHAGTVGIAMEYLRGETLEAMLERRGTFGVSEAASIGIDVCRALAAVHRAGLVHGDVKPHNVIREQGGRIVLMDFGAGDALEPGPARRGPITATPLYMAPELFEGGERTARTEIYSVGVLLYHLLTGEMPVSGSTPAEIRRAHTERHVRPLHDVRPEMPTAAARVVERALARDPRARFESVGRLELALRELGPAAPQAEPPGERPARRRGPVLVLALAAALVAAAVAWWALAPASGVYSVEAAMMASRASGEERLFPGAEIALGDRLFLELEASEDLYVYVLNEDAVGNAHLLFPMAGSDLQNPLEAGVRHRLPGTDGDVRLMWQPDSRGGVEHILILASPERLIELEDAIARLLEDETSAPLPALASASREVLRGLGGVARVPDRAADQPSRLFELAGRLLSEQETTDGVWCRQMELRNP